MAQDGSEFWLYRADGGSVHFVGFNPEYGSGGYAKWLYEATEVYDPHGLRTELSYDFDIVSVGPAGKILDRALEEAGIKRNEVYVTNTVKHFKWEPRGKRRIHQKPTSREIAACRPWLEAELRVVRPKLLVCLGATAAQAILGPSFRVTRERGKVLESTIAPRVLATVHPSSLLRQPDEESREREYTRFVADLRTAFEASSEG